ncbi:MULTISPECIES: tape measure protein [unclassified Rhizobium]|uniref:tape measure protein n=1 Tax=unclassified Rhizobium TaxID=2613769 RepID=UPI001AE2B7A8|nr:MULTISPECIES: tape measure protein [unclassified Rhizobium]MBP2459583.1 tape measure domain-containing protein [Rhizobium sp. PvP014]MBP2531877.1 tape measure domain-containing protein [Rhizobium sp. PvP099]
MAATDLERLVVQLSADIKKYENALNRASGVTNRQARAIETRFAKMNKTIEASSASAAAGFVKAFALVGGVQGFKNLSDSATRVDNALKVAGLSGAELERTYQALFAAATKNAVPIETLVSLYSRLSLVQGELGVSQQQVVAFTENIGLALRAGGTSAQEASGALTQLAQALGGGVVRAEEFASLIEGAPTILQAAAAGIEQAGGSVAKLRKIMLDGELSSRALFDGFQAGSVILEQRVAGSVLTIDNRLTNLQTALINAAREFNTSAKAGETFGNAIDQVSAFVNSISFDGLIGQIQGVVGAVNTAIGAANSLAQAYSRLSGYEGIGRDIVNMLPGDGAQKSFFGGGLTVGSTAGITDRINQAFEGEIQKAGDLTTDAIKKSVLGNGGAVTPSKAPRVPAAPKAPTISLADPKYAVPATPKKGSGGGGGRKRRGAGGGAGSADEYQREIEQIKERTIALQTETTALSQVNPLVNDYGFALQKARTESDLLAAAQKAGLAITPALKANIEQLATGYANASVAAEQLSQRQDNIRQAADDFRDGAKDAVSGFISDVRSGTKATEALGNALTRIGDKLLDFALDGLFSKESPIGSIVSSFFGGIKLAGGGRVKGRGGPTGDKIPAMLSDGEHVTRSAMVKKHGPLLDAINADRVPHLAKGTPPMRAPSIPNIAGVKNRSAAALNVRGGDVIIQGDVRNSATVEDIDRRVRASEARIAYAQQNGWR